MNNGMFFAQSNNNSSTYPLFLSTNMINLFRKYVSVVALILMGLFLLDLTSTEKEDLYVME